MIHAQSRTRTAALGEESTARATTHLVLVGLAERLKLSLADDRKNAGDVEANNLAARAKEISKGGEERRQRQ